MTHTLPPLPYAKDALAPIISAETLEYHYGKHHQTYVDNLNKLIVGTEFADSPLEQIALKAQGPIFNNAAQVWNHTFYWNGLKPKGGGEPKGKLAEAINKTFGSIMNFQQQFSQAAVSQFGSGWAWLVKKADGSLAVCSTANQDCPCMGEAIAGCSGKPILGLDVWEHAYYLNYQNRRPDYIAAFWNVVNWDVVAANFAA